MNMRQSLFVTVYLKAIGRLLLTFFEIANFRQSGFYGKGSLPNDTVGRLDLLALGLKSIFTYKSVYQTSL